MMRKQSKIERNTTSNTETIKKDISSNEKAFREAVENLFAEAGLKLTIGTYEDETWALCKAIVKADETLLEFDSKYKEVITAILNKSIDNSSIEDVWKYGLLHRSDALSEVHSIDYEKYIKGSDDAFQKLEEELEGVDLEEATEEEKEKYVDYTMGLLYLVALAAEDEGTEGIIDWITHFDNSRYGGWSKALSSIYFDTKGLMLQTFLDWLESYFYIDSYSEEFFDDMEGLLWDSIAELVADEMT